MIPQNIRIYLSLIIFLLPTYGNEYLNTDLSFEDRLESLMSMMTVEEKVGQMCQYVGLDYLGAVTKEMSQEDILNSDSVARYEGFKIKDIAEMVVDGKIGSFLHVLNADESNKLQSLALESRLKIPLLIGIDAIHGNGMVYGTTIYPSPISIAATFTDEYAFRVARETALEMRATGSQWAFTPNVDIARDPRWGRVGETFGEDPYLVSNLGAATIRGFQMGDYTGPDRVIACAKHLIAGSDPVNGLNFSPMDISQRSLRELYLKPYKSAVNEGVYSIMSAHNEINGVPCVMNRMLMEDIVRGEYGFDGFYVSDWMDIERLEKLHFVADNLKEACYLAVDGGTDMHMHGPHFLEMILELHHEGRITEERINQACSKILMAKFKLGLFENPFVDLNAIDDIVFSEAHQKTALEIARKSIVLLKNDQVLPLKDTKPQKILVTGPNANNETILGDWALAQPDDQVVTIFEGLRSLGREMGHTVDFYDSNEDIRNISKMDITRTLSQAKDYDIIFVVVGDNSIRSLGEERKVSGENVARTEINLAGNQLDLVKGLHELAKKIIVIYVNGKPISEPWVDENMPAIIEAWEPGSFGGQAVAEVIFGLVNPSGKLPITFPRSSGHLQMVYNHKPSYHFKKYAFNEVSPLYPFGHGLSYSKFEYSNLKLTQKESDTGPFITLTVEIENKSDYDGEEVVQVYFRDTVSQVTRPVKELVDYTRVLVKAQETELVSFDVPLEKLAYLNAEMELVVEPGTFNFMVGGSSEDDDLLTETIEVEKGLKLD